MSAISLDLRNRILAALEEDSSSLRVAKRFKVSASFVRKLRCQVRNTGDPTPRRGGGKQRLVRGTAEQRLRELVAAHPDATLIELAKRLKRAVRVSVSETTMWRSLRRMGLTRKKRPSTRANATATT